MTDDRAFDDEVHGMIAARFLRERIAGTLSMPPPSTLFRLMWLCRDCSNVHQLTGNAAQTQNAATAFMLWDYPLVIVMSEAFCVLAESEGRDLGSAKDLAELVPQYTEFLKRTRG